MKKFTLAALALFVSVCALPRPGNAAQMALKLDGEDFDSFVAAPNNDTLDKSIGSNLTIEAWINLAANLATDTHPGNEYIILNKEDSYEISVRNTDPATEGTFQAAIQPAEASWAWTEATEGTVPLNKWTHVAATWDGLLIRTFVNGKLTATVEYPGPDGGKGVVAFAQGASMGLSTLKIGRRGRGVEDHSIFNGLIDEVRISKTLRYTEKGFDVPTGEFTPDADTIVLYHFNEVSTAPEDLKALNARFDANPPSDDNGDGDLDPALEIKGVIKDASVLGNNAAITKNAKLVAADTPIKEAATTP